MKMALMSIYGVILGSYSTYEEHYRHVHDVVRTNANKYTQDEVDNLNIDEDGPHEHLWSHIAPSTEESRARSLAEGSEQITEFSRKDLQRNPC